MIKEPIFLEAKMVPRVWGGDRLAQEFGRELPSEPIGESWEIHGDLKVKGSDSTLDQLVQERGAALLGTGVDGSAGFPLLTKWLDCKAWLSVQVHPDDQLARDLTGDPKARGKTEAWYVHKADENAELIHGLADGVSSAQLVGAEGESILPLLSRFRPHSGQLLFTPAGEVHALGPGNLIYEVQQSCDLTYRFYDWGRDREIHPDKALQCVMESRPTAAEVSRLSLSCPFFKMELVQGPVGWEVGTESFQVLAATTQARMKWESGVVTLKPGQSVLLPAAMGFVEVGGTFLRVGVQ